jgi:hypothetical protein
MWARLVVSLNKWHTTSAITSADDVQTVTFVYRPS